MKPPRPRFRQVFGSAACLLLAPPAALRADEMATFLEWQQKYQTFMKETARPLVESYQRRLLEMEKAAAAARNYALAAKIKTERLAAAKDALTGEGAGGTAGLPEASATGRSAEAGPKTIILEAAAAELGGGVSLDQTSEVLTGWTSDKAYARWTLPPDLKTGGYEIEIVYSCPASEGGGTFVFSEDSYFMRRETSESGAWDRFKEENLGTLRIKTGSRRLSLSPVVVKGAGVFRLKQIKLKPAPQGAPA